MLQLELRERGHGLELLGTAGSCCCIELKPWMAEAIETPFMFAFLDPCNRASKEEEDGGKLDEELTARYHSEVRLSDSSLLFADQQGPGMETVELRA
jgi:hypothetical protein